MSDLQVMILSNVMYKIASLIVGFSCIYFGFKMFVLERHRESKFWVFLIPGMLFTLFGMTIILVTLFLQYSGPKGYTM